MEFKEIPTNGWIEEQARQPGKSVSVILYELIQKESYSKCNQKSLQSKINDTIKKAKELQKNKGSSLYREWQSKEFHPPLAKTPKVNIDDKSSEKLKSVLQETKNVVSENKMLKEKLVQSEQERNEL